MLEGRGEPMQRLLSFVALALLGVLIATGGASANHSNGQGPPGEDFVVGTGHLVFGAFDVFVHVNAMSGPSGEDPRGHVVFRVSPPAFPFPVDILARVTCVRVEGNEATVGIEVTKSKAPGILPEGSGGFFSFVDNGEPGRADTFEGFPVPTPPTVCIPSFAFRPFTYGNYVVHDAAP
jgi:hypothetical protein